jgi:ribonuclease VapC
VKDRAARFVLDAFAVLAHLEGEPGGRRVKAVLSQAVKGRALVYLCLVNYGEVIYITEREKGLSQAQIVIAAIDQLPIIMVDDDRELTLAAAHLKARYPISYADAFAAALARSREAVLLTGDPEFHQVESLLKIEWLGRG